MELLKKKGIYISAGTRIIYYCVSYAKHRRYLLGEYETKMSDAGYRKKRKNTRR